MLTPWVRRVQRDSETSPTARRRSQPCASEPAAKNGALSWRGEAYLENGEVLGAVGEGAFEALGNHQWRTRLIITTTDGQIFASDGLLDLAKRSLTGKNLEWS